MKDLLQLVGLVTLGIIGISVLKVEAGINDYWHGVMVGLFTGWLLWKWRP